MQDVYSHFQERISSNSSSFSVVNPNNYRDGIRRYFYFKYLHIVPEYFSMLATENELENETLNPIMTSHGFIFEFYFHDKFYGNDEKFELNIRQGPINIIQTVKEFNRKVDEVKNAAYIFSPVIIDWVDAKINSFKNEHAFNEYMRENAHLYYKYEEDMNGEEISTFNPETHSNVLPRSCANMAMVNPYQIPDDDIAFLNCRLRLIIAPNTRISLSNSALFAAFGFTDKAFGVRGEKNRYHLVNPHPDKRMIVIAERPPANFVVEMLTLSNVYIMNYKTRVDFQRDMITSKSQEMKPEIIYAEMVKIFHQASMDCYIRFGIHYDTTTRRFRFTLSNNAVFESRIRISILLQPLLGFGSEYITMQNLTGTNVAKQEHDINKYLNLCKILTQDTCDVIVTMENVPSILNRGQPEQIVAALLPKDSILKNVKNVSPKFFIPENDQDLNFKIYRHSELGRGKTIQLGWPIDCYIYGMICGEPIKTVKT